MSSIASSNTVSLASTPQPEGSLETHPLATVNESCALQHLCNTYLGEAQPRSIREAALAAVQKNQNGQLSAEGLSEFFAGLFEIGAESQELVAELVAWLAKLTKGLRYWGQLGFHSYEDYLVSIDPLGKVQEIIEIHERTLKRKNGSEKAIRGCWEGAPELVELLDKTDSEERWRKFTLLAKATAHAPELAKYCLNMTILARLQGGKRGKGATRRATGDDFKKAAEMARGLDRGKKAWERKVYTGIGVLGLTLCQGMLVPGQKSSGPGGPPAPVASRSPDSSPYGTATIGSVSPEPSVADTVGSTAEFADTVRPTAEPAEPTEPAVDGPAAVGRAIDGLHRSAAARRKVAAPRRGTCTPPPETENETTESADTVRSTAESAEPTGPAVDGPAAVGRAIDGLRRPAVARRKVTAPHRGTSTPPPETENETAEPHSAQESPSVGSEPPKPPVEPRTPPNPEGDAAAAPGEPENPYERTVTDATKSQYSVEGAQPMASSEQLLTELSGGVEAQWGAWEEMVLEGGIVWLLEKDPEVAEILSEEREIYRHHLDVEPNEVRLSLFQQALRQDPGSYALAVACLKDYNPRLVATLLKGEGLVCAEAELGHGFGDLRFASSGSSATGRRLTVEWVAVSRDGKRVTGKKGTSPWVRQATAQASVVEGLKATVMLRPASMVGAALLGQRTWLDPGARMESNLVLGADRDVARAHIRRIRCCILEEIKRAHQDRILVEEYWYGRGSYFCSGRPEKRARLE